MQMEKYASMNQFFSQRVQLGTYDIYLHVVRSQLFSLRKTDPYALLTLAFDNCCDIYVARGKMFAYLFALGSVLS